MNINDIVNKKVKRQCEMALRVYNESKHHGYNHAWVSLIDDVMRMLDEEAPLYADFVSMLYGIKREKSGTPRRRMNMIRSCMEFNISEQTGYRWKFDAIMIFGMEAYKRGLVDIGVRHDV